MFEDNCKIKTSAEIYIQIVDKAIVQFTFKRNIKMKYRRPWTQYQDQLLQFVHQSEPDRRWNYVAKRLQQQFNVTGRSEKQCRDRYEIYIKGKTQATTWDLESQKKMFSLHKKYGNKWSLIATHFQRKNGPFIKNQFYSRLRRSLRKINQLINVHYKKQQVKEFDMKMAYNVATYVDKKIKQRKQANSKQLLSKNSLKDGKSTKSQDSNSSPLSEGDQYEIIQKLLLFSDDSQPKHNSRFYVDNSFLQDIINQLIGIKQGKANDKTKQKKQGSAIQEQLSQSDEKMAVQQRRLSNKSEHEEDSGNQLYMVNEQSQGQQIAQKQQQKKQRLQQEKQGKIPISDLNWRQKFKYKMNKQSHRLKDHLNMNMYVNRHRHTVDTQILQKVSERRSDPKSNSGNLNFQNKRNNNNRLNKNLALQSISNMNCLPYRQQIILSNGVNSGNSGLISSFMKQKQEKYLEKSSNQSGDKDSSYEKKNEDEDKKYEKSNDPSLNTSKKNNSNDNSNDNSKNNSNSNNSSNKLKSLTPLLSSFNSKPSQNKNSNGTEMRQINSEDKFSKNNSNMPFLNDSNKNKFEHVYSLANNYQQQSDREYSVESKIKHDIKKQYLQYYLGDDSSDRKARTQYMQYENCFVLLDAEQNSCPLDR